MKKLITLLLIFITVDSFTQNLQLHYDYGRSSDGNVRDYFTATLEMFRPDTFGYTFFFVDMDFDSPDKPRGMSLAYWEIAREIYIPGLKNVKGLEKLALHVEYNDGTVIFPVDDSTTLGANINSAWLVGLGYPVKIGKVFLGTSFMYRWMRDSDSPDFQFTIVWYEVLFKGKLTFAGYLDIWSQDDLWAVTGNPDKKIIVLQTEPQLWYNVNEHLGLGGEVEISKNFITDQWEFMPTVGCKWEF